LLVSRQIGGFFYGKGMASKLEVDIPQPKRNPDGEAQVYYTLYYNCAINNRKNVLQEHIEDSPGKSRSSLIERVYPYISSLRKDSLVLDLGAGRQIFEKEYEDKYGKPECDIITLDIAKIPKERLLAKDYQHVLATGRALPFKNETFAALISNMAFDFMLPETLTQLHRVIKQGAWIFLNLHHPSLTDYDIDTEIARLNRQMKYKKNIKPQKILQLAVYQYHKHLRDNRLLFETEDQIRKVFGIGGFEVKGIEIKSDQNNKWWEVDLRKLSSSERESLSSEGSIFDSKNR